MKNITVKQMIESLSKLPPDANFDVAVYQTNQRYPICYLTPIIDARFSNDEVATMADGQNVRIQVCLPSDDKTMMITQVRKLK